MSEFLILGATGKTGRRVATLLAQDGHAVRAAARTPGDAADGITPVRFDWADRATWDAALTGADGVYVIPPALRVDYADDVGAFVVRAAQLRVRHAVFLSARGAEHAPDGALFQGERAVQDGTLNGTVVRPTWFAQNFSEAFLRPQGDPAVIVAPAGDGAVPFVDAGDIAAVVAAALTEPARHAGATYVLSGPQALTFADVASALSTATGRTVEYLDPGADAWRQGAIDNGLPADYAGLLATLFGVIRDGHDAYLSDGVQQALGREPGSLQAWLERDVAASPGRDLDSRHPV